MSLGIASCLSDDDNDEPDVPGMIILNNEIIVNDESFNLDTGYVGPTVEYDEDENNFVTVVALLEDSATYSAEGFTGISNAIVFNFYIDENEGLREGTYDISFDDEEDGDAYVYFALNVDLETGDSDLEEDLDGGTVTIFKNGVDGGYRIVVESFIDDINNTVFQATYEGSLRFIEELGS